VKFTCSTKDIASAVGAASKIVNAHTTVPILSNVLLTADESGIKVRATDLELTLEQSFPAEIAEAGATSLLGRIGRPDEIAAIAVFLASDMSSFMAGEVVQANGGAYMA